MAIDLTEMWDALSAWQSSADEGGYGEAWRAMCEKRTTDAAHAAARNAYAAAVRGTGAAVARIRSAVQRRATA